MTQHTSLLVEPTPAASSIPSRSFAPVLIQVPRLAHPSNTTGRSKPIARNGRRRLRREVRVAISAMAFAIPMSWALISFAKIGPDPDKGVAMTASLSYTADAQPSVTISLEPQATLAAPDSEAPIVLHAGYLVDDNRVEDAHHAGN